MAEWELFGAPGAGVAGDQPTPATGEEEASTDVNTGGAREGAPTVEETLRNTLDAFQKQAGQQQEMLVNLVRGEIGQQRQEAQEATATMARALREELRDSPACPVRLGCPPSVAGPVGGTLTSLSDSGASA